MRRHVLTLFLTGCLTIISSPVGFGEDEKPKEAGGKKEVTLTGVFEAVQSTEHSVGTEKLTAFRVSRIVPHGTTVKKGQVLVTFETKDIDEKIEAAEISLRLARISHQEAEFSYQQFMEIQKLDRAAAERSRRAARQAHDNYVQVDRDRSVASAEFSLKSYRASYENAAEELKQLEQMYKEDELTEESEEIVLKRAKQAVESAKFRLEGGEIQTGRTLQQTIPKQAADQDDAFARAELNYKKAIHSLDAARQKQDIEIRQKRDKFKQQEADLAAMQAERAKLAVTAAHDGIVYHGPLNRGKLSDKPSALKKGAAATGKQVLVTLVNPARLQIRTDLTETLLSKVSVGMQGTATPNAVAGVKFRTRVKSVDRIPYANNKFNCLLTVQAKKGQLQGIVPGMTCVIGLPEKTAAAEKTQKKDK